MLNVLFDTPFPLIDNMFSIWAITPSMSKLVLLFSFMAAYMIGRVTGRSMFAIPLTMTFLVACALFVNWVLIDVELDGFNNTKRMMAALFLGESLGGLLVMAFLKTGSRSAAGA